MLLRPRKVNFKNSFKKRSLNIPLKINNSKIKPRTQSLVYGQSGVLNKNSNFLFFNKHLFKVKLFLKKAVRRSGITNRFMWFKVFPHIPVTKKVIGSRMGKGKGKPSNWAAKIPYNCIFIEFRNLRLGRFRFFAKQLVYKLPGSFKLIQKYSNTNCVLRSSKKLINLYDHFY